MDPFESAFSDRMKHLDTGADYFIERNADGTTRYRFYASPEMAAEKGAEVLDAGFGTFAEEVDPMSVGEFAQRTAEVGAGMASGAAAGAAGLPGDVVGLVEGAVQASKAPEGQRGEAFIQGLSQVSERIGSAALMEGLETFVNGLDIDQESKDALIASARIGEITGLPGVAAVPGAAKAGGKAVTDYVAGAPARVAERGPGMSTFRSGFDPFELVDRAIASVTGPKPEGVTLAPAQQPGKVVQLEPQYRVNVQGFEPAIAPSGKQEKAFIPNLLTPNNAETVVPRLEQLNTEFPDPLSSAESYAQMVAKAKNSNEVMIPPAWMIENANNPEQFADWFKGLSQEQIDAAGKGLAVQDRFKAAYQAGAGPQLTGQLMLWSILSRSLSAFPHESGYKDLAAAAKPFIEKAARGEWSDADTEAWLEMVPSNIPADSPGRSATSNANDFGAVFLKKMAQTDSEGRSGLAKLHELVADPNVSSKDVRRAYYTFAEKVGIDNKILSFALLVSGRNDVVVLDRIQINRMWAGAEESIYDDVANQFSGAGGLVHYEALERSLQERVKDLYARVGRPDQASVGRYHWESWVLSSSQVVSHPTLETVVKTADDAPEGVFNAPVAEGRYHTKMYGAQYEKLPDGSHRYIYSTSDGEQLQFSKEELTELFEQAFKKSAKIIPADFPGVNAFKGGDRPWFEFEGVDREKLDQLIRKKGRPLE